ncbi:hypothetical protein JR316_0005939 [Psilocybe cubensis]|uniref:Uncharacterized protein n=2 Tax=Psilocybe cubensis TaxID=181762 RepID=A0ACB8H083_PSICU|nr:hypothetical protein JR316_0005939 [Psilocybe cubensis]KAH9481413.1 hypothetical protein JR316_0005939 [Psilocybe cubensis]
MATSSSTARKPTTRRARTQPKPCSFAHPGIPNRPVDANVKERSRRTQGHDATVLPQYSSPSHSPSYICILPPEILAEIFAYCIPTEQFPIPSRTEAPLLLTHVSSFWRSVAISTPDLWSSFHINYKDPTEDIALANLWLSRSLNKRLSISIAVDFGEQPQQAILDALCRHAKRWKHVRFDFRHLLCPPMYSLDLAQGNVPELTTFEFHARDISNTNISPITHLLSSAPQIRELSWVDDLADMETLLELPLSRISRLSLSMEHGTLDYLKVLNECPNLEHIRITKPLLQTTHQSPLFLSKLSSLNISSDLTGILDHLILPALREVRIYSADNEKHAQPHSPLHHASPHVQPHSSPVSSTTETWDPTAFLSLVDRSACAITSLSVTPPMSEVALLMCLPRMSASLVKLSIEGVAIGDTLLGCLTRPSTSSRRRDSNAVTHVGSASAHGDFLCPLLTDINLDTRIVCSPGVLAGMVRSRMNVSECNVHSNVSWTRMRKLRVADGHNDIEMLKELSRESHTSATSSLVLDIIPKKPNRMRNRHYFFRRKLCASR